MTTVLLTKIALLISLIGVGNSMPIDSQQVSDYLNSEDEATMEDCGDAVTESMTLAECQALVAIGGV